MPNEYMSDWPCKMKHTIVFLAGLVVVANGQGKTTCTDGWLPFEGFCYLFGRDSLRFPEAELYCQQHHSHLIEMYNSRENAFIKDHLRFFKTNIWWLGMTDEIVDGIWKFYNSNANVNFTDWYPGEPSSVNEHCGVLHSSYNFRWADVGCSNTYLPLCKKSGWQAGNIEILG